MPDRGSSLGAACGLVPAVMLAAIMAWPCAARAAGGTPEGDAFRQVKVDVFDENWPAVLRGCEAILARDPKGPNAAQATFYRARALSKIPGREADAARAFRGFVARFPGERLLVEQSWSSIFTLACGARRQTSPECANTLAEGLANPSAYVSTLAAIRASDTRDEGLRRRALGDLKKALATQSEPDIRNEILIAILKIDPKEVPPPASVTPRPARPGAAAPVPHRPSLIRMTIFNKAERRYDLKINLPVAFAQMLINSLGEEEKQDMRAEAHRQGIDLDDIFEAIQKSGTGRFLDVDTPESRIEVWIE